MYGLNRRSMSYLGRYLPGQVLHLEHKEYRPLKSPAPAQIILTCPHLAFPGFVPSSSYLLQQHAQIPLWPPPPSRSITEPASPEKKKKPRLSLFNHKTDTTIYTFIVPRSRPFSCLPSMLRAALVGACTQPLLSIRTGPQFSSARPRLCASIQSPMS